MTLFSAGDADAELLRGPFQETLRWTTPTARKVGFLKMFSLQNYDMPNPSCAEGPGPGLQGGRCLHRGTLESESMARHGRNGF